MKQTYGADPSSLSQLLLDYPDTVSDVKGMTEEEVELQLSYLEFEKLLSAGKITSEQARLGRVKQKDLPEIEVESSRC